MAPRIHVYTHRLLAKLAVVCTALPFKLTAVLRFEQLGFWHGAEASLICAD